MCVPGLFLFLLQYASVKKNEECFMSPQDFVTRFLHAHTDIRLSDEATALLTGVVDQKKDGLVFCLTAGTVTVGNAGGLYKFRCCRNNTS